MRLYQLEYFIKIVECGSITKAAQELYLSQPSLTKAIASLETEYNILLFQRSAKGIHLTPKGREFLQYAKQVVESSRVLEETFGTHDRDVIPSLMIASQQLSFVHPLVVELYRQNEGTPVQIHLREGDRGDVAEQVAHHGADIGLVVITAEDTKMFRNLSQSRDLEMHMLDTSPPYACVGPKSIFYDQNYVDAEEAEPYLHVILDMESSTRQGTKYQSVYRGVDRDKLVFTNSINTCKAFLLETDALLYTPKWELGLLEETDIRAIPIRRGGQLCPADMNSLLWIKRKREKLSPLEQQFVELLNSHFRRNMR